VIKVKLLSSKTEISTGITNPAVSYVLALYALQNAMLLTPCCPKAGPTGGAGFALPACRASLITATIFFAIRLENLSWSRKTSFYSINKNN